MNNYKLHITPIDNEQWIGHAILNEEVVFSTTPCSSPQECSQILSKFAAAQGTNGVLPEVVHPKDTSVVVPSPEAPRKCCGRS